MTALPAIVGTVGLLIAGAAQAQPGRSGMSTEARADNVSAFRELSAFGVCYARFNRANALALIATEAGSREEGETFRRLISGEQNCVLPGTMRGSLIYFRGVIAEGLLSARESLPAELVLAAPTVEQVRNLHDVARYYVSGHRSQAQTVLATRTGSQEETAAIAAIWSDVRACFPPTLNVRLNAPWVRFLLAEALLRTGTMPRPAAGS